MNVPHPDIKMPNRSCTLPVGYNATRVHLHVSGFSESRNMVHSALDIQACGGDLRRHLQEAGFSHRSRGKDACQRQQQWRVQGNVSFLGTCREGLGLHLAECCQSIDDHYNFCCMPGERTGNLSISYVWKHTLVPREADEEVAKLLRKQYAAGMRVVAVYSALPYNQLEADGYNTNQQGANNFTDAWTPPQAFFDQWLRDVRTLFRWLRDQLAPYACVIWKGNRAPLSFLHPDGPQ